MDVLPRIAHGDHHINVCDINVYSEMPGTPTSCLRQGQPDKHPLPSEESMRSVQVENGVVLILNIRDVPPPPPNLTRTKERLYLRRLCGEKDDSIIS